MSGKATKATKASKIPIPVPPRKILKKVGKLKVLKVSKEQQRKDRKTIDEAIVAIDEAIIGVEQSAPNMNAKDLFTYQDKYDKQSYSVNVTNIWHLPILPYEQPDVVEVLNKLELSQLFQERHAGRQFRSVETDLLYSWKLPIQWEDIYIIPNKNPTNYTIIYPFVNILFKYCAIIDGVQITPPSEEPFIDMTFCDFLKTISDKKEESYDNKSPREIYIDAVYGRTKDNLPSLNDEILLLAEEQHNDDDFSDSGIFEKYIYSGIYPGMIGDLEIFRLGNPTPIAPRSWTLSLRAAQHFAKEYFIRPDKPIPVPLPPAVILCMKYPTDGALIYVSWEMEITLPCMMLRYLYEVEREFIDNETNIKRTFIFIIVEPSSIKRLAIDDHLFDEFKDRISHIEECKEKVDNTEEEEEEERIWKRQEKHENDLMIAVKEQSLYNETRKPYVESEPEPKPEPGLHNTRRGQAVRDQAIRDQAAREKAARDKAVLDRRKHVVSLGPNRQGSINRDVLDALTAADKWKETSQDALDEEREERKEQSEHSIYDEYGNPAPLLESRVRIPKPKPATGWWSGGSKRSLRKRHRKYSNKKNRYSQDSVRRSKHIRKTRNIRNIFKKTRTLYWIK